MSKHGDTERSIIDLFEKEKEFTFEGSKHKIINIGKPRPSRGECKTDIYIQTNNVDSGHNNEFKISIKQSDADFLENKISLERAEEIFGSQAKKVMTESIDSQKKSFLDDYLVYFKNHKRTKEKCIKIGWKFELLNKNGGERSGLLKLTDEQKIDVYSGTNLNDEKKDSKVNGLVVKNSGVANYILTVSDTEHKLEYYVGNLKEIEGFAVSKDIYFACKAINYRSVGDKWDGNRPLSVFVEWNLVNGLLKGKLILDKPLEVRANEVGENIRSILKELEIEEDNFKDLEKYIDGSVKTV